MSKKPSLSLAIQGATRRAYGGQFHAQDLGLTPKAVDTHVPRNASRLTGRGTGLVALRLGFGKDAPTTGRRIFDWASIRLVVRS